MIDRLYEQPQKLHSLLYPGILIMILLSSCNSGQDPVVQSSLGFSNKTNATISLDQQYWYSGNAELTRYDLRQNRYNAVHNGEVVNIFVTEEFLTDKQVKNDNYTNPNSTSVLKLNQIRRFTTGLYDYSMMTSVFTRADGTETEKVTLSSQDWCGQAFVQVNRDGNKYKLEVRSYFEAEGDYEHSFKADILEDEIPNLIRIDPKKIPTGEVVILPSLTYLRFSHDAHKPVNAEITVEIGDSLGVLRIDFDHPERLIEILFDSSDHNKILSWSESHLSTFDKRSRETIAVRSAEMYGAYWQMNELSDTRMRDSLMLQVY